MFKETRRAQRRHDAERVKKNRQFYCGTDQSRQPRRWGVVSVTPAACSCYACGNPRKFFKEPTVQEQRFFQIKE